MPRNLKNRRIFDRQRRKRRRAENRALVLNIKLMFGCLRCPEIHPDALQFHHRDPKQKRFTIQKAISQNNSTAAVLREIVKCDVLCGNCHAKEHSHLTFLPFRDIHEEGQ